MTAIVGAGVIRCSDCGYTWRQYENDDHYKECPQCVPGQPRPMHERRADPTEFLGPEYVWDSCRGPRGCWCPLSEYWLLTRPTDEQKESLDAYLSKSNLAGHTFIGAILTEFARLHGDSAPRTETNRARQAAIADRCQRLDEELRRKRAECDELRDRVQELEAKR